MKRSYFILVLILFIAVNCFSQTKTPLEVAQEFGNLALKNDFEAAKSQIDTTSFKGIKLESLKIDFKALSNKEFSKPQVIFQEVQIATAKFTFISRGVYNDALITVTLAKMINGWKISSFDVKISWNFQVYEAQRNSPLVPNFQSPGLTSPQYSPFALPQKPKEARIIAEPYSPEKNPVRFLGINPKKS